MTTLTVAQTLDLLADLAAGALGDVFTQDELQRLYDRAEDDYNLAVYYGWRQIAADSARWVSYKVAQTSVDRGAAFDHIAKMVAFWSGESRTAANQVLIVGANPVPTNIKPRPVDDTCGRWPYRWSRWRA